MKSAVLFVVFNRPDTTLSVFEAIRAAQPPRLYVAADGARPDRNGETVRCEEVRRIVSTVDWPCEVHSLFRPNNVGCRLGVPTAISWFFTHETEGIILEDDILPLPSFFKFCDEMLELYRYDDRVLAVSGGNNISDVFSPPNSYFFSRYNNIWGWATWRRSWQFFDIEMSAWPEWRDEGGLKKMAGSNLLFVTYWKSMLNLVYERHINTCWDYQWSFACWLKKGLVIQPAVNLTENIGFGTDATHTVETPAFVLSSVATPLRFPLSHPPVVERSHIADKAIDTRVFSITPLSIVKRAVKNRLKLIIKQVHKLVRLAPMF